MTGKPMRPHTFFIGQTAPITPQCIAEESNRAGGERVVLTKHYDGEKPPKQFTCEIAPVQLACATPDNKLRKTLGGEEVFFYCRDLALYVGWQNQRPAVTFEVKAYPITLPGIADLARDAMTKNAPRDK